MDKLYESQQQVTSASHMNCSYQSNSVLVKNLSKDSENQLTKLPLGALKQWHPSITCTVSDGLKFSVVNTHVTLAELFPIRLKHEQSRDGEELCCSVRIKQKQRPSYCRKSGKSYSSGRHANTTGLLGNLPDSVPHPAWDPSRQKPSSCGGQHHWPWSVQNPQAVVGLS